MFEQAAVRITAGMLLWSTAALLIGVAYHARVISLAGKLSEMQSLAVMIDYMIAGAFFGVLFGGIVNAMKRPLWPNVVGAFMMFMGLSAGRLIAPVDFPFESNPNHNGLVMIGVFAVVGAVIGLIPRRKAVALPFALPRDKAQVELERIQARSSGTLTVPSASASKGQDRQENGNQDGV